MVFKPPLKVRGGLFPISVGKIVFRDGLLEADIFPLLKILVVKQGYTISQELL